MKKKKRRLFALPEKNIIVSTFSVNGNRHMLHVERYLKNKEIKRRNLPRHIEYKKKRQKIYWAECRVTKD